MNPEIKIQASREQPVGSLQKMQAPTSNPEASNKKHNVPEWLKTAAQFATALTAFIIFLQWREQVRSLETDQRAWVNAEVKGNMVDGKFMGALVTLVNSGKTPAIGIEFEPWRNRWPTPRTKNEFAKSRADRLAVEKREDLDPQRSDMMRKEGRVHPQGFFLGPNVQRPFSFPVDSVQPIENPRLWNYYQWYITYKDIFGREHETWFCYRIFPSSEPVTCPTENGMN